MSSDQHAIPPSTIVDRAAGWSWWQAPRVVLSQKTNDILIATVAAKRGGRTAGSQAIITVDASNGEATTSVLGTGLRTDDHNAPAVIELPDGVQLAAWTGHDVDHKLFTARRTTASGPWTIQPVGTSPTDPGRTGNVTYANLLFTSGPGGTDRVYNFYRGPGQDPAVMWSEDEGRSWTYGGRLFGTTGVRPYMMYAADRGGRVHFVATDGHPHDVAGDSLWSGYLEGDDLHRTDGTFVARLGTPGVTPADFTPVWRGSIRRDARIRSDSDGWTCSLAVDLEGRPVVTFSQRRAAGAGPKPPTGVFSHLAWYGRWTGHRWALHPVAELGGELTSDQPDYTGLLVVDPGDVGQAVISTDIDPRTDQPTTPSRDGRSYRELFTGRTKDSGATWTWKPLTSRSSVDNIRPTIASDHRGRSTVAWMSGTYDSFYDFATQVRMARL